MKKSGKITVTSSLLLILCFLTFRSESARIPVIFDTDIGNDIDDALALSMLNNYVDMGKVSLLGVMCNKGNINSVRYIDVVDTWYGHSKIPLGMVRSGKTKDNPSYTEIVPSMKENGKEIFPRTIKNYSKVPNAVSLYRKLLWHAQDHSVIIISVGFSTNLAELLNSKADSKIPLNGVDLVRRKVKLLSMMAGCFNGLIKGEYNVAMDVASANEVFKKWPTKLVTSPFELGNKVIYPATVIEKYFSFVKHHPVADAYQAYLKMPYDRPSWDLTAVLYAMEPSFFSLSPAGVITVDLSSAMTNYKEDSIGNHRYLMADSIQSYKILQRLIRLTTIIPNSQRQ